MCKMYPQNFRRMTIDTGVYWRYLVKMGALRDANLGFRRALSEYGNANIWKQELLQALTR